MVVNIGGWLWEGCQATWGQGEQEVKAAVPDYPEPEPAILARRWDEKAGLQARYLSVPINNELYWLNGGQP
jgi:hypothetical protein